MTDLIELLLERYELEFVPEDIAIPEAEPVYDVSYESESANKIPVYEDMRDQLLDLRDRVSDVINSLSGIATAPQTVSIGDASVELPNADEYTALVTGSPAFDDVKKLRVFEVHHMTEGQLDVFVYLEAKRIANEIDSVLNDEVFSLTSGHTGDNLDDPMTRLREYFSMKAYYIEDAVISVEASSNPIVDILRDTLSLRDLYNEFVNETMYPLERLIEANTSGSSFGQDIISTGEAIGQGKDARHVVESLRKARAIITRMRNLLVILRKRYRVDFRHLWSEMYSAMRDYVLERLNAAKARIITQLFTSTIRPAILDLQQELIKPGTIPIVRHIETKAFTCLFDYLLRLQHELAALSASDKERTTSSKSRMAKVYEIKQLDTYIMFLDRAIGAFDSVLATPDPTKKWLEKCDEILWPPTTKG